MNNALNSPQIIWLMLGICVLLLLFIVFFRQIKVLIKITLQGAVGLIAVFCVNFLAMPLGFSVGLNLINAVFIGLLGIPGIATLYIFSAFI